MRLPSYQDVESRDKDFPCLSHPLSVPLQDDVRLLPPPVPAVPWTRLTVCLPRGKNDGLTVFRFCARVGKVRPFRRHCIWPREETYDLFSQTAYLLVQACQRLWLAVNYDVYQAFTCVDLATPPSLRPTLALAGTPLPHGFDARLSTTTTLSQALHTAALPQPHGLVGYYWWHSNFHPIRSG
jgi:hypothetical protein